VALIDPLADLDTKPFWSLVADPKIEVVLHAGAEDLTLCHQLTGQAPANVFDVQIAAGLVGSDYPMSLRRLVQSMLRVRLHKSQTLTDWRRRPLSEAQRLYAVEDVAYIPALHHLLTQRLRKRGRLSWAKEEFARFEEPTTYVRQQQTQLRRLRGAGSLDSQRMAVATELLEVREALAKEYDRPARAVLRDHLLIEIARNRWATVKQIRTLRGLHLRRAGLQRLADAVKRGLAIPSEQWPTTPPSVKDTPEEAMLTALLTAVLRSRCLTEQIAYPLLATKQSIREAVHAYTRNLPGRSALTEGWRAEAAGKVVDAVLSGRAAVRVGGDSAKPRLSVGGDSIGPSDETASD
jgi:ribonuclease D